jgi:hypothetical protein
VRQISLDLEEVTTIGTLRSWGGRLLPAVGGVAVEESGKVTRFARRIHAVASAP